jgi:hypothetical protein
MNPRHGRQNAADLSSPSPAPAQRTLDLRRLRMVPRRGVVEAMVVDGRI